MGMYGMITYARFISFFNTLEAHQVPLVVFSAGIEEVIVDMLEKTLGRPLPANVSVVSNRLIADEEGNVTAMSDPLVHVFNKGHTMKQCIDLNTFNNIKKDRCSIFIVGDSTGDASMGDEIVETGDTIFKIGFLNTLEPTEKELNNYTQLFDVVLHNDPTFEYINDILAKVLE